MVWDGEDEGGIHHTTARDLALIMAYAIKNATFVHITQTRDYTFTDISGKSIIRYIIPMLSWIWKQE